MGPELGVTYHHLVAQISDLRHRWQDYIVLFGTSKERVDTLNQIAGSFAFNLQRSLYDSVSLQICRMTDKDKNGGKYQRLTIRKLRAHVPSERTALCAHLDRRIKKAEKLATPFRSVRDTLLAHADYGVATGRFSAPTQPSRKQVAEALDALSEVVVAVHDDYFPSHLILSQDLVHSSAIHLLAAAEDGLKLNRLRRKFATSSIQPTIRDLLDR